MNEKVNTMKKYEAGFRDGEAKGRKAVLDELSDLVDGRIEGLDDLLATPPEQRSESAQDRYLKEARFELGLVQDEIKVLRR
jgi:hypothetical protein